MPETFLKMATLLGSNFQLVSSPITTDMASSSFSFHLQPKLQSFPSLFFILKSSSKPFSSPKSILSSSSRCRLHPKKPPPSLQTRLMGPTNNVVELNNLLPPVRVLQREEIYDGSEDSGSSFESQLNKLSKWLVSVSFGVMVICRHDGEAMWAATGSVVNSGLSVVLKKLLNQGRPVPSLRAEPGMPSSHAQSIFYIFMFAVFSIVEWLGINEMSLIASALTLAFGVYLSWLRISQRFHTVSQVVIGAAIGNVFSLAWYWLWIVAVHEAFKTLLWVRIVVILGADGFCAGFIWYVILHWSREDR